MAAFDALVAKVNATVGPAPSTVVLIDGIATAFKDAGTNQTKLAEVQHDLHASTVQLSEAVAANPLPATPTKYT